MLSAVSEKHFIVSFIITFGTLSFPIRIELRNAQGLTAGDESTLDGAGGRHTTHGKLIDHEILVDHSSAIVVSSQWQPLSTRSIHHHPSRLPRPILTEHAATNMSFHASIAPIDRRQNDSMLVRQ